MSDDQITKEFLESVLKSKIDKFIANSGSNVGDGYTCTLFTVDIWRGGEAEAPESILIKTYPVAPARQHFLDSFALFLRELRIYDTLLPELLQFQVPLDVPVVKPPLAEFIAGQFVKPQERTEKWTRMENCIVLIDLRKHGNYRLPDRFLGLDLDHYWLAIRTYAKLHALSWVYKMKFLGEGGTLEGKFPFLGQKPVPHMVAKYRSYLDLNCEKADKIVNDPKLSEGIAYFKSVGLAVTEFYFGMDVGANSVKAGHTKDSILRVKKSVVANEEPWLVLVHGDACSNNMMFSYDERTGNPVEVILVDLQASRESDPMVDLVYTLYTSTCQSLRQTYLTFMLQIYYDTFTEICESFSVPALPGWSWEEFNRRFHRAKIFGAYIAISLLPQILENKDELQNMDKMTQGKETSEDLNDVIAEMSRNSKENPALKERLTGVIQDLMEEGVI